jgi:hypothetical protein
MAIMDREESRRKGAAKDVHNIANLGERCGTSVIGSQDQKIDKLGLCRHGVTRKK